MHALSLPRRRPALAAALLLGTAAVALGAGQGQDGAAPRGARPTSPGQDAAAITQARQATGGGVAEVATAHRRLREAIGRELEAAAGTRARIDAQALVFTSIDDQRLLAGAPAASGLGARPVEASSGRAGARPVEPGRPVRPPVGDDEPVRGDEPQDDPRGDEPRGDDPFGDDPLRRDREPGRTPSLAPPSESGSTLGVVLMTGGAPSPAVPGLPEADELDTDADLPTGMRPGSATIGTTDLAPGAYVVRDAGDGRSIELVARDGSTAATIVLRAEDPTSGITPAEDTAARLGAAPDWATVYAAILRTIEPRMGG